ncbi:MAG: class I SAM-dependent methyltransferase [Gemmatimonadota bacterium]
MESGTEWYRRWFGEEYVALYPHRNEEEAASAVGLFLRAARPPGNRILDLACGAGRHLRLLREAGLLAVGLDLSMPLLRLARSSQPNALLVRGDMRDLPFADGSFAGVTSFFTSFGYFDTPEEDRRVLAEVRRVLSRGGTFLLDFLNAGAVRASLVPEDSRMIGGRRVRQHRRIEDEVVVKQIEIERLGGRGPPEVYHERVRLYEPEELEEMLVAHGLAAAGVYGEYSGATFGPSSSRLILTGSAR